MEQTGSDIIVNGKKVIVGNVKKSRKKTGNKWFETQDQISYWDDFNQQLIIYNDIAQKLSFTVTRPGVFVNNTVYFIKSPVEVIPYLLVFLNSKLIDWYYRTLSVQLGTQAVRLFSIYMEKLPIPKCTDNCQIPKNDADIYKAYQLTSEEIKYLSEFNMRE